MIVLNNEVLPVDNFFEKHTPTQKCTDRVYEVLMLAVCVQNEMMKCFEFGLVTGVAKVCVTSLRICSLEMQDQMARALPSILISLSKISATVAMAIPVLAFLSSECCQC